MGNYTWDGYCFQKNKSNPKYTCTIFYNPVHIFLATPMFSQNSQPSMTIRIFSGLHMQVWPNYLTVLKKNPDAFKKGGKAGANGLCHGFMCTKKIFKISQDSNFWTPTLFGHVWTASQQSRHSKSKSVNTCKYH